MEFFDAICEWLLFRGRICRIVSSIRGEVGSLGLELMFHGLTERSEVASFFEGFNRCLTGEDEVDVPACEAGEDEADDAREDGEEDGVDDEDGLLHLFIIGDGRPDPPGGDGEGDPAEEGGVDQKEEEGLVVV